MKSSRTIGWSAVVLAVVLTATRPGDAKARSFGITGYSGKQSGTCNQLFCHGGGVEPQVRFEGPETASPGETVVMNLVIVSSAAAQIAAGLDVAVSAGALGVVAGQGTRISSGEITHDKPKDNDAAGVASFDFTWTAPAEPGEYVLFGAGNSVNLDFGSDGDLAKAVMRIISVRAIPTPTPTPEPCSGDCDGDGRVSIDELVVGITIASALAPVETCPRMDSDRDGVVTIDELVAAVGNALDGCP